MMFSCVACLFQSAGAASVILHILLKQLELVLFISVNFNVLLCLINACNLLRFLHCQRVPCAVLLTQDSDCVLIVTYKYAPNTVLQTSLRLVSELVLINNFCHFCFLTSCQNCMF